MRRYPRIYGWILAFLVSGLIWWGLIALVATLTSRAKATTRQERATIERVNQRVNRDIRFRSDIEHYGVDDLAVAEPEDRLGDCEDYALTKRDRLINLGFAQDRMRILSVTDETGQSHAVLAIDGELILDNRFNWTETWTTLERYGYRLAVCGTQTLRLRC